MSLDQSKIIFSASTITIDDSINASNIIIKDTVKEVNGGPISGTTIIFTNRPGNNNDLTFNADVLSSSTISFENGATVNFGSHTIENGTSIIINPYGDVEGAANPILKCNSISTSTIVTYQGKTKQINQFLSSEIFFENGILNAKPFFKGRLECENFSEGSETICFGSASQDIKIGETALKDEKYVVGKGINSTKISASIDTGGHVLELNDCAYNGSIASSNKLIINNAIVNGTVNTIELAVSGNVDLTRCNTSCQTLIINENSNLYYDISRLTYAIGIIVDDEGNISTKKRISDFIKEKLFSVTFELTKRYFNKVIIHDMPEGVIKCNYLQSSGAQCVDLGIKPTINTRITFYFQIPTVSSGQTTYIIGSESGDYTYTPIALSNGKFVTYTDLGTMVEIGNVDTDWHYVDYNNEGKIYFDGIEIGTVGNLGDFANTNNICVFGKILSSSSVQYGDSSRFSDICLYENGTKTAEFTPCIATPGTEVVDGNTGEVITSDKFIIGLYNRITEKCFTNSGEGRIIFATDEDITDVDTVPEGFTKCLCIESNGAQQIITQSITQQLNNTVYFDVLFTATNKQCFCECWEASNTTAFEITNNAFSIKMGDTVLATLASLDTERHIFEIKNRKGYIDGNTNGIVASKCSNMPYYIFLNRDGDTSSKIRLYSLRINDNVFVPSVVEAGTVYVNEYGTSKTADKRKPGLYNCTDGRFYTNTKSGDDFDYIFAEQTPLTLTTEEADNTIALVKTGTVNTTLEYCVNDGNWETYAYGTDVALPSIGDSIQFRQLGVAQTTLSTSSSNYLNFMATKKYSASGDLHSLSGYRNNVGAYSYFRLFYASPVTNAMLLKMPIGDYDEYAGRDMMHQCTQLIYPPNKLDPASMGTNCFVSAFNSNSSMLSIPKLPKHSFSYCYYRMFENCTSLTEVHVQTTSPAANFAEEMFYGCSNLNKVTVDFTSWTGTSNWLSNVSTTGIFVRPEALTDSRGVSYIPTYWGCEHSITRNLPSNFIPVNGLKSDGYAYINTNVGLKSTCIVKIDCFLPKIGLDKYQHALFGARKETSTKTFSVFTFTTKTENMRIDFGDAQLGATPPARNKRIIYEKNGRYNFFDGVAKSHNAAKDAFSTGNNAFLFTINHNGRPQYDYSSTANSRTFDGIIYGMKMWYTKTQISADFISCKCLANTSYTDGLTGDIITPTEDTLGMYDYVTNRFFTAIGGSFTEGDE